MATILEALRIAVEHHQAGRLPLAESIYRQILKADPRHADTLNLLGTLLYQDGRFELAVDFIQQAIALNPRMARYYNNLGAAYRGLNRPADAARSFQQAVNLDPADAGAYSNLGVALQDQGRFDDAIASFEAALRLKPDYAEAHYNLGHAHQHSDRRDLAIGHYLEAIRLLPSHAKAHYNLGLVYQKQGRLEEAVACYETALRLDPQYFEACGNRAVALQDLGHMEASLASFERALELNPNYNHARKNRSMAWLQLGDFERGWPEYEWRWQFDDSRPRSFAQPRWQGEPLAGRTILLHSEQGLGDTLQFIRYAPLVQQLGARVLVDCQPGLVPLLRRCAGINELFAYGDALPAFDVHSPLLSLPGCLGTTLATIPAAVPYLFPDPTRVERWRGELPSRSGIRIGICWQGNPEHDHDLYRSFELRHFGPVAAIDGVQLLSLQKGRGSEQLASVPAEWRIVDLGSRVDPPGEAFVDSAAIMAQLDLVIASDTSLAHLAGGLGVSVWVALTKASDWRWLLDRDDSPWYPTMRLFRQSRAGDWESVFRDIAAAVRALPRDA